MIGLIWSFSTVFCILSPGKDFTYYWFQFWGAAALIIPFSILLLNDLFSKIAKEKKVTIIFNVLIAIFIFDLSLSNSNLTFSNKEYIYEVRDFLKDKVKEDTLIVASDDGTHILYWLLNVNPPARFIHTTGDISNYIKSETDIFRPEYLINPPYEWYSKLKIKENYKLIFIKSKYKVYGIK